VDVGSGDGDRGDEGAGTRPLKTSSVSKRGGAVPLGKKVQVLLTDEQYALLKGLAEKRDASISELIRQAIEQVYMSDLERDLGARGIRRLGETPLLIAEEGEDIGIRGPEVLAGGELDT
jgi:hypothetical protein